MRRGCNPATGPIAVAMRSWLARIAVEEGGQPGQLHEPDRAGDLGHAQVVAHEGRAAIGTALAAVLRDELAALVVEPRRAHVAILVVGEDDAALAGRDVLRLLERAGAERTDGAGRRGRGTKRRSTAPRPRGSGCRAASLRLSSASMSHATFSRWTGTIAAVRSEIFASTSAGSSVSVSSTSANTTSAPIVTTALTVAMNVNAGTITSSPGPTSNAANATRNAAVPLDTASAYRQPNASHTADSNASTRAGVRAEWYRKSDRSRSTAVTASISSSPSWSMPFPSGSRRVTAGVPPSIASRSVCTRPNVVPGHYRRPA